MTHPPSAHHGRGSGRYIHNQIHHACGKAQLALNATGAALASPEEAQLLLDDLQQLSQVVGELHTVLTEAGNRAYDQRRARRTGAAGLAAEG
jgi:hypothetical protein